jgi:FtsP/CotA-like multicopper oxidase with cupredoxin domain
MHDVSHGGRIGNTVTINGSVQDEITVHSGERIRLRLINAANARIFALEFSGHTPHIVAYDGQPVDPHPTDGRIVIGPAMRIDLVIDMAGQPGEQFTVTDTFYKGLEYRLVDLKYGPEPSLLANLRPVYRLAPNTIPEPNLKTAERQGITFGGGMMGGMMMGMMMGMMNGPQMDMRQMMHNGKAWTINGVAATGHMMEPLLTLKQGRSYVLALDNNTAWHHPIHLNGHSFRVITRNGQPTRHQEWQDTVLMSPKEKVEIAFLADNPGGWMFHCHILEHQAGGMMGVVQVV